jgi:hypothetical protein
MLLKRSFHYLISKVNLSAFQLTTFKFFPFSMFQIFDLLTFSIFDLSNFRPFDLLIFSIFDISNFRPFDLSNFGPFDLSTFKSFPFSIFQIFDLSIFFRLPFVTPRLRRPRPKHGWPNFAKEEFQSTNTSTLLSTTLNK